LWLNDGSYNPQGKTRIGGGSDNLIDEIYGNKIYYTTLTQNSSREVKDDIRDLKGTGDVIDRLRPVVFVYKKDPEKHKRFGLIHEEAMEVLPEICKGDMETPAEERGINYMELVPMLLKEIQDLRKRVAALEEKVKGDE
jgi:hypothetical protein